LDDHHERERKRMFLFLQDDKFPQPEVVHCQPMVSDTLFTMMYPHTLQDTQLGKYSVMY